MVLNHVGFGDGGAGRIRPAVKVLVLVLILVLVLVLQGCGTLSERGSSTWLAGGPYPGSLSIQ
jgi:hypothetical protein